ncbi:hypothetical protein [Glaciecola sp. MF2-115]|uniref:hypothetical protein n=1 Tax=Glaciecola sp. MF2-115 TaxID=3384827 RepID=UPI0039A062FA
MKFSLLILLLLIAIIVLVKMLGVINTSPVFLFLIAFGIVMIVLFVAFTVFAKKEQKDKP